MQPDEPGIPLRIDLAGALNPQTGGIARRNTQFDGALHDDEAENDVKYAHALLSTAKPAVKPGPSAVISVCCQSSADIRSSTNSTLAADMLP